MKARWFIRGGGKLYGPLDDARLRSLVSEGKIDQTTDLALDPRGPWHPAGRVRGLFPSFGYLDRETTEGAAGSKHSIAEGAPVKSGEVGADEDDWLTGMLAEDGGGAGHKAEPTEQLHHKQENLAAPDREPVQRTPARPSVSMTRCPACGAICARNARGCPQCGYRFPSSAPFVLGGLILAVLVIGSVVATVVHKKREEAEIWREVHRRNQERQEKLQREVDEAWDRLIRSLP
jgi:hypothetical protein